MREKKKKIEGYGAREEYLLFGWLVVFWMVWLVKRWASTATNHNDPIPKFYRHLLFFLRERKGERWRRCVPARTLNNDLFLAKSCSNVISSLLFGIISIITEFRFIQSKWMWPALDVRIQPGNDNGLRIWMNLKTPRRIAFCCSLATETLCTWMRRVSSSSLN